MIKPADKNLGPTIMDRKWYIEAGELILTDNSTYRCIENFNINSIRNSSHIEPHKTQGYIPYRVYVQKLAQWIPANTKNPLFYILHGPSRYTTWTFPGSRRYPTLSILLPPQTTKTRLPIPAPASVHTWKNTTSKANMRQHRVGHVYCVDLSRYYTQTNNAALTILYHE